MSHVAVAPAHHQLDVLHGSRADLGRHFRILAGDRGHEHRERALTAKDVGDLRPAEESVGGAAGAHARSESDGGDDNGGDLGHVFGL